MSDEKSCGKGKAKPMLIEVEGKPFDGCTCNECPSAKDGSCEDAYDRYNTGGDCLAEK